MHPASRTPDGDANRCRICGNEIRLDPSRPPGDAPCPFCGSLVWFDPWYAQELIDDTPGRIRVEFHGGCKDGIVFDDSPQSLAEDKGYRYYRLAKTAQVGTRFRDVPIQEYGKLLLALVAAASPNRTRFREVGWHEIVEYLKTRVEQAGSASELSRADVEQITHDLQHVTVHVYEAVKITETPDMIAVSLRFVEEVLGL